MTFTHNHKDDTILERDGNEIDFTFFGNTFTYDDESTDRMTFRMPQEDLLWKLGQYFDSGCKDYAEIFDDLTLPAQDALWNALVTLNNRNQYL